MALQAFYQTVAQLSFTLLGLWWLVLQTKYQEWIGGASSWRMASNISLHFMLPGVMSLFAMLSVSNLLIWQIAFFIAGGAGLVATVVFRRGAPQSASLSVGAGRVWVRWAVESLTYLLFAAIALVALLANAIHSLGLAALTIEGILVSLVVVLGLVLAWAYFVRPAASTR
jgi:hypothetical protein